MPPIGKKIGFGRVKNVYLGSSIEGKGFVAGVSFSVTIFQWLIKASVQKEQDDPAEKRGS